ncbi:hypothetical protein GCM10020000_78280 [Streptomyces olivoverticillatus]
MIPGPHRMKGGALLLGAEEPGLPGPFGTWRDHDGQEGFCDQTLTEEAGRSAGVGGRAGGGGQMAGPSR